MKLLGNLISNNQKFIPKVFGGIDTTNVLATYEDGGGNMEINYTATQDCYAILWGGLNFILLNGYNVKNTSFNRILSTFELKKGNSIYADGCFKFTVFGIKY